MELYEVVMEYGVVLISFVTNPLITGLLITVGYCTVSFILFFC